jgi:hypothetical protein
MLQAWLIRDFRSNFSSKLGRFTACFLLVRLIFEYLNIAKVCFYFYCCDEWGYIVAFTQVLTMDQIYMSSPLQFLFFISPPLIPGVVSTGIIFAFTYMFTHFIACYSHSSVPLPNTFPLPLVPSLSLG